MISEVVISNRLVSSPCAIVADVGGYTANVERMISVYTINTSLLTVLTQKSGQQNTPEGNLYLHEMAKKMKLLEINPRAPLMEGLLRRIEQLPDEEEGKDLETEEELKEVVSILIDGALVRSGYSVSDSNKSGHFHNDMLFHE